MKKKLFSKIVLSLAVFCSIGSKAQTVLFSENMGSPAATTPISSNTFQNSTGSLCYSGTGDMRSTQASSGYTGASAGGNAYLAATAGKYFQIGCIDASACSSITLSFGVYKSVTTTNTDLQVSFSTDGGATFGTPVTMTVAGGAVWSLQTISSGIPSSNNLAIRFTNTNSASQYRIDDVNLSGSCSACTPPTIQTSALSFSAIANNSLTLNWVRGNGSNVIVVARQGAAVNANPSNGTAYTANSAFGSGSQIGVGNYVVYNGPGTLVNVTGLTAGTTYYFSVYEYNTTTGTPCYLSPAAQSNTTTTGTIPCLPTIQASSFSVTSIGTTSASISWTSGDGTNVLIVAHPVNASTFTPVNGTTYTTTPSNVYGAVTVANGTVNVYPGSYVAYNGVNTNSLTITNLNPGSTYYFTIFEYGISGSPCYLTPALTGSIMPLATPVSTTCLQIKSILVNACDGTSEPKNEMVYFRTGSNPLATNQFSIAGAPTNGNFVANKWPNTSNSWRGVVQNTLTASNVSTINGSITKCGYVKEPSLVAGVPTIPANKNVILVGSEDMSPTANSFANLTDTVYMIFQAIYTGTNTLGGNFTNWTSTTDGTRGLVLIDGGNGCTSNTVTYEPQLLLNHADGDGASYNDNNTVTYYNSGCQAPFIPLGVTVSNDQKICFNGSSVLTATPSGVYNGVTWSGGTGTFSNPSALTTTYTAGAGDSGNTTIYCIITRSCTASSAMAKDSVIINVIHTPQATLSGSNGFSLCPSTSSTISYSVTNASVADVVTPSWSSPAGSGTTYMVSAPSGTAPVNYTLNLSNMCGVTTKTFDVFPLAAPSVSLSAHTLTACPGNTVSLTATSNTGNYSWNNPVSTNSSVTFTASASTSGTVSATNSCGTADDTYTLTVTPTATLTVDNPNVSLCSGQSATITATSNTGTYTWTPAPVVNTNSIVVNSTGTHTVTTNNVCNSASVAVNVTVSATPLLSISATSSSVCSGGQTSSVLSLVGSTGTYSWSTGATTSTISVSTPGVYTATVDAGFCGTASSSINIGITPIPTVTAATTSTLLCDGATATLSATSNMSNFVWYPGSFSSSTISTTSSGVYTVEVSNACATVNSTVSIVTQTTPVLSATTTVIDICPGSTATLSVSGGSAPYVWSSSTNTMAVNTVTTSGTFSVSNSNACGFDSKTFTVNIIPNPIVTLSQSSYTVCDGSPVTLVATSSEGNYSWLPFTNTTNTLTFTPSGSTSGAVTTTNVCTSHTATYNITVITTPTIEVLPTLVNICGTQSATLIASSDATTYTWQPGGSNSNTLVTSLPNTYTVSSSNACFTVSATSTVQVSAIPTLTITSSSSSMCPSGQTETLTLSGSVGTYSWSTGATGASTISISTPGVYTATVDAGVCGTASNSINIGEIDMPTVSIIPTSTLLCNGATATLTANSNMSNFSWSNGQFSIATITVNTTNTYTVGVSNSCETRTTSVNVVAANTPTLNLTTSSPTICPNETASLTVTGGAAPYVWSNTSGTGSMVTTSGGSVTVTNSNACGTDTETITVLVSQVNAAIAASPQSGIVPLLVDFTNNSTGATTYAWAFGNGNTATTQTVSTQTYSNVGQYYAHLIISDGICFDMDSVLINVLDIEPSLEIPNVFTPNADSVNDIFMVKKHYHIVDLNCVIYDRWGLEMSNWEGLNNGWDGKSGGKDVPAGTYFYIINAKDVDGKEIKKQGSVNLFR